MARHLAMLATVCLLFSVGCGSSPQATSTASPSAGVPAKAFGSARELRATLAGDWTEIVQSPERDVLTLPKATTCDVYVRDPHGSMLDTSGTRHWSQVLFAVYPQAPGDEALGKADVRVHLNSAYGSPLHRLSGANWAIWSAYRPALLSFREEIGGELVQLYEREEPVMRDLKPGERVSLQCGLSLVIPSDYGGYYTAGMSELMGELEGVASHTASTEGLLYSFGAQSLAPGEEDSFTGPLHWPLVARAADRTIEVRCAAVHLGTPEGLAMISVVVRLPGRPIGLVRLETFGDQASDDPGVVMGQVRSMWARFMVTGVELPPLAK